MNIALFDLDYTLIDFDSDHAWGEYLCERGKVDAAKYRSQNDKFYADYRAGPNRFTLPLKLREAGYYEYTARITVPEGRDGWKENNLALGDLHLRGEGRVLLVTDPQGDGRDWQKLAAALREG